MQGSDDELIVIADLVCVSLVIWHIPHQGQIQKGSSSARSDDTKSIKGAIIDWITPRGEPLQPPLARNLKSDRGFQHERTGFLLCPVDWDWDDPK